MPVHVAKRGPVYRVVEADGQIARTDKGNPKDGGGHRHHAKAAAQARAINQGLREKQDDGSASKG